MVAGISFTDNGLALLKKIKKTYFKDLIIFNKNEFEAKGWLKTQFKEKKAIIFVSALGIAVRLTANLIHAKDKDPAVLVIDEKANFIIPMLSGHLGGANKLAEDLANFLGGKAVITTATDLNNKFAVDLWAPLQGFVIDEPKKIKYISAAILKNEILGFCSDFPFKGELNKDLIKANSGNLGICVSYNSLKKTFKTTLNIIPKKLYLGLGCRKNIKFLKLEEFILSHLEKNNFSIKAIAALASIDLKKEETAILKFSEKYNIPFQVFSAQELNKVEGDFEASAFVKKITGTNNVCERAAKLISRGNIILPKTKENGLTIAIAEEIFPFNFNF